MFSVTKRIDMIKQPRGGYIKKKDFVERILDDGINLNETENIHPSLVGSVVDYMTRFFMGTPIDEVFKISLKGAANANETFNASKLLSGISDLDHESIVRACKLVGYDVCYRAGMDHFKPVNDINPNKETTSNIVTMIKRSQTFWKQYGPIVKDGFTFEGGYTDIISRGDGDYLTEDTLWDFKVLKEERLRPKKTLQLLVYYIMGKHSIYKEFDNIKRLGIYNPRLNKIYTIDVCNISKEIIDTVSHDVIGYGLSEKEVNIIKEIENKESKKDINKSILQMQSEKKRNNGDLDKEIYGFSNSMEYISQAFPPKVKICDNSIYEKKPVFWSGNYIPDIVEKKKLTYIVKFKSRFKIKHGETPFVMTQLGRWCIFREPLATSEDHSGSIIESKVTLMLTSDDFGLFKKIYDVKELEILDGCYFL